MEILVIVLFSIIITLLICRHVDRVKFKNKIESAREATKAMYEERITALSVKYSYATRWEYRYRELFKRCKDCYFWIDANGTKFSCTRGQFETLRRHYKIENEFTKFEYIATSDGGIILLDVNFDEVEYRINLNTDGKYTQSKACKRS